MQISKAYRPPLTVLDNIQRGLVLRDKFQRESAVAQNSISKINKAKEVLQVDTEGKLSFDAIKCIYNELSRLEKSVDFKARAFDGGPNDNLITWYAFGASSGLAWSRSVLKQEGILKSYTRDIKQEDIEQRTEDEISKVQVVKAVNDEKRMATFLVLEPHDLDYTTNDLHGHWYDAETVEASCINFNRFCRKANMLHLMPTTAYEFIESYIQKTDCVLGDRFIKKGSWLATILVDESPLGQQIWDGIKSGEFNGLSIQCMGVLEDIE